MPPATLVTCAEQALLLTAILSLPIVAVAVLVGVVVAAFQAASQIQDPTIAHLPRLVAVIGALTVLGPWMGAQLSAFAERMMLMAR